MDARMDREMDHANGRTDGQTEVITEIVQRMDGCKARTPLGPVGPWPWASHQKGPQTFGWAPQKQNKKKTGKETNKLPKGMK